MIFNFSKFNVIGLLQRVARLGGINAFSKQVYICCTRCPADHQEEHPPQQDFQRKLHKFFRKHMNTIENIINIVHLHMPIV
jgi:hypothetical protein